MNTILFVACISLIGGLVIGHFIGFLAGEQKQLKKEEQTIESLISELGRLKSLIDQEKLMRTQAYTKETPNKSNSESLSNLSHCVPLIMNFPRSNN